MKIVWEKDDKGISDDTRKTVESVATECLMLYHMGQRDTAQAISDDLAKKVK